MNWSDRPTKTAAWCLATCLLITGAAWAQESSESAGAEAASGGAADARPLTMKEIQSAIDRGMAALRRHKPPYVFQPDAHFRYHNDRNDLWRDIHAMGSHSMALWAMFEARESYQNPKTMRRLYWVLSDDRPYTFDRAMRMMMLERMRPDQWRPWMRRDSIWLQGAMDKDGAFSAEWSGRNHGSADRANSVYGVLGLAAAESAGVGLAERDWRRIDDYWRKAQTDAGGWTLADDTRNVSGQRVSGPMTAAGLTVLSITERSLLGPRLVDPSAKRPPEHSAKALRWLDEHFTLDDPEEASDFYFYMWMIQRVGHVSGYRTFNGTDWYTAVTRRLLDTQKDDGTWEGSKGPLVSTAFALLYLTRAHAPIAVAKLRFDGRWNNRPHDLLNFVEWASDSLETPLVWQIVDATLPTAELIESPIIYISTDKGFDLSAAELAGLREYVHAGGTIVINPESGVNALFSRSVDALAEAVAGHAEFEKLPADHVMRSTWVPWLVRPQASVIDNGVRPLIVLLNEDVGGDLQARSLASPHAFNAMLDMYLYTVGRMTLNRNRLTTHHLPAAPDTRPTAGEAAARVAVITHAGVDDPEPGAWVQLTRYMQAQRGTPVAVERVGAGELTGEHALAMLVCTGDASITDAEAEALRAWVEAGGLLWIDAAGGSRDAARNAAAVMERITGNPRAGRWVTDESPLLTGQHAPHAVDAREVSYRDLVNQRYGIVSTPRLVVETIDGRPAIIRSDDDVTAGLVGLEHWGIYGYTVGDARALVANAVLLQMANRKAAR